MRDRRTHALRSLALLFLAGRAVQGASGILTSQVGYDPGSPMRAIVRSDDASFPGPGSSFEILDPQGAAVLKRPLLEWGDKWGSLWSIADFSGIRSDGTYTLRVAAAKGERVAADPIVVGDRVLWSSCFEPIALTCLDLRARRARTGKGWADCGSDLQEFSSHAVAVDGLCDVLAYVPERISPAHRERIEAQIANGCSYLAHLQDKAERLGLGEGAVIHEDRQAHVVTGDVAKAAMIFARAGRLLESAAYLDRSESSFAWAEAHGPVANPEEHAFFPHVHGAPPGSRPPQGLWMTRDLLMMARAAVELYRAGKERYKERAIAYADRVLERQVPRDSAEDGLYGHFYTYDDYSSFGGIRFTEKAAIHCGAWSEEGRTYNKGGHYPHHLVPLLDMVRLWPSHPRAARWRSALRDFAYGYLLPACRRSPFLILPAGCYAGEGLLFFGSWYHAHNCIYAFAASLALDLEALFNDSRFGEIATGNLQWIAGLNCGLLEGDPPRYVPASMVHGVGVRFRGSWSKIPGTICNGFSASRQFRISPPRAESDAPAYFDDEGYIAHSLAYLGALARLEASRPRRN